MLYEGIGQTLSEDGSFESNLAINMKYLFMLWRVAYEGGVWVQKIQINIRFFLTYRNSTLKGQCREIFYIFSIKKLYLDPIWTGKNGFAKLLVFAKIFAKNVCRRSQRLRGHGIDYVNAFGKLWRLLTDFKGTIGRNKVLGSV